MDAGRSGQTPEPGPDEGAPPGAGGPGQGGGTGPDRGDGQGDTSLDEPTGAHCAYVRSDYQPTPSASRPVSYPGQPGGALVVRPAVYRPRLGAASAVPVAAPGEGPGAWYVYRCSTPGATDALYRPPVWIPDAAPAAVPSAAGLAARARDQLRLPGPRIETDPAGDQLVRLPSWLWLDPAGWGEVTATAAAGGVSVTAEATPVEVSWDTGDGASVVCAGPGTPFPPGGDPESASPDCGYTYRTPSAGAPGGVFTVTATVRWDVRWAGAGQGGVFPGLTTTSAVQVRVVTVDALTTGGG